MSHVPTEPAYLAKVRALYAEGGLPPGVHACRVFHDDWCLIWATPPGVCNCDPDLELIPHEEATHA